MTEDELREMIFEANGEDRMGNVGLEDFMRILMKP
jgi:hypothetical protein